MWVRVAAGKQTVPPQQLIRAIYINQFVKFTNSFSWMRTLLGVRLKILASLGAWDTSIVGDKSAAGSGAMFGRLSSEQGNQTRVGQDAVFAEYRPLRQFPGIIWPGPVGRNLWQGEAGRASRHSQRVKAGVRDPTYSIIPVPDFMACLYTMDWLLRSNRFMNMSISHYWFPGVIVLSLGEHRTCFWTSTSLPKW